MLTGSPGHLKAFDYVGPYRYFLTFYAKAFGHRLWQRYGFERVLRDDEATLSVARYILENPLRARLVQRVDDYPFVGSRVYSLSEILEAASTTIRRSG